MSLCLKKNKTPEQLLFDAFNSLDIDTNKKTVLHDRYLQVLENFHFRANALCCYYYLTRVIVTVGSILVPAFLSIQGATPNGAIYWTTWNLSVAVTICNGFMTLFKLDKKFYFINTTLELLHSEGWQYIGLSGRYATKENGPASTHENQFIPFFKMAEKIKIRQVEEEFWKSSDTTSSTNTAHPPLLTSSTPATQQGNLASLPDDKKNLIEGWLGDMRRESKIGLQPRVDRLRRQDTTLDIPILDEGATPSSIPKSPSVTRVSVRPQMQFVTLREETVLSDSQRIPDTINESDKSEESLPEDTIVEAMPNESNIRK